MNWLSRVRDALDSTGQRVDDDVLEELAQHAAAVYDRSIADGCTHDRADARATALIARWAADAAQLRRPVARPFAPVPPPEPAPSPLTAIAHDFRYALRQLRRQPRFAALVVLTMALGIGAAGALGHVTYTVLARPLPWPNADRLFVLKETRGPHAPRFGSFSNAAYVAWKDAPATVEAIGAWRTTTVTLTGGANADRLRGAAVTASLFRVLGVAPAAGRFFTEAEELTPVVVIADSVWNQRFARSTDAIGASLPIDGVPHTIVGVLADDMAFPDRSAKLWVPYRVPLAANNLVAMFEALAVARPGVDAVQVADEGTARGRFAADTGLTTTAIFGGQGPVQVSATSLAAITVADVKRPLLVLLAAVIGLFVVAVLNIAGLHLVRVTTRAREFAIRASLGASDVRIARQLTIESLVMGLAGGAAGCGVAVLLTRAARAILPADFPRLADLEPGLAAPVLAAAMTASALVGIVIGLLPLRTIRRGAVASAIGADGRAPLSSSSTRGMARARRLLITVQVAMACVLLAGAMLLIRSFTTMLGAERGYDPSAVLSARVVLPASAFDPMRRSRVLGEMAGALQRVRGVRAAAFSTETPLTPGGSTSAFTLPGPDGVISAQASPRIVSPGYFAALGLEIREGRSLSDSDTETSEAVAVVNETFRQRYLGDRTLGAKVPMSVWGGNQDAVGVIVGVIEDVRYIGASTPTLPEIYFSHRQIPVGVRPATATLFVRGVDSNPSSLAAPLRQIVADADPSLVAESVMTLEDRLLGASLARPRLYATLLGGFAALAVVVTAVGLFAVLSYAVTQRTREFGVRAALGARQSQLLTSVLRQGLALTGAGLAIGLILAAWLLPLLDSLVFGVSPGEPWIYVGVTGAMAVVGLGASLLPAIRAARLDPLRAIRLDV